MTFTIAIIAAGEMGSAVGARLVEKGARVVTSLEGRSAASRTRAARAGLVAAADDRSLLADADYLLSIVPPGSALDFARRMAAALRDLNKKPVFVDCNAVSPATAIAIGQEIEAAGAAFVDAGIVGPPPKPGASGTRFYASGSRARDFARLNEYGLDIRVLDERVGTASALKLSYASLTKGFTALGAVAILAAERAGISDALRAELALSRPDFLAYLERQMPGMYAKAYRWVAEMEEISSFLEREPEGAAIFEAAAELYRGIAADLEGPEVAALKRFAGKGK